ncbi:MAG: hypothetical protein Q4C95_12475 [Planctomycetia bacterium]|nr:hypothetical protein [Planctomycetia bacterium]
MIYNNDSGTYFESVVSSNPSYSFSLSRKTTDGKWKINNIQPLKSGNRQEMITILGGSIYSFLNINTIPLAALLKSDNVEIESFEEKEIDDEIVVNMTLVIKNPELEIDNHYVGYEKVELLFRPEKYGYIPMEFIYYQMDSSKKVIRDQFHNINNFMIPFECKTFFKWGNSSYWNDYEGEKVFAQKVFDKSEFYLSHYGLPEPDFGESRPDIIRYVIIAIGLLLISLGIWRIYQKRQEKSGV